MTPAGQVLKRHREAARLSQQALATMLGRSLPAVSQWERGVIVPRVDTAERIDAALNAQGEILAAFGYATPVDALTEIADLRAELNRQRAALEELTALVTRGLATRADLDGDVPTTPAEPPAPRARRQPRRARPAAG